MHVHSLLDSCESFEWDKANSFKNWLKHRVSEGEAEQGFFNEPLLLLEDKKHSDQENRFWALGFTDQGRLLFVAFTVREKFIRIISARDMNRKERANYEKFKANSKIQE